MAQERRLLGRRQRLIAGQRIGLVLGRAGPAGPFPRLGHQPVGVRDRMARRQLGVDGFQEARRISTAAQRGIDQMMGAGLAAGVLLDPVKEGGSIRADGSEIGLRRIRNSLR